jgi:A/G-specific adenine glycosylase
MNPFATKLLHWSASHGRSDLPWQRDPSPYRVWVSEIMLQQTRVETVIPYFQRFIGRFPDLCSLGSASQDEVLGLWSGLGYYARARNLHRAAAAVCEQFGGEIPAQRQALEALPGIGRSTAAAILSIAFGQPEAILDGNVKRVLSRYCGVEGWSGQSGVVRQLWDHAERLMPQSECGAYTQAIMDLGATLCGRREPACGRCPVAAACVAHREGRVEELPYPRPGKKLPLRQIGMVVLHDGYDALWMERRPEQGVWGGLWSFPELQPEAAWYPQIEPPQAQQKILHTFTHFRLEITPLYCRVDRSSLLPLSGGWVTLKELEQRGVAAPVRRLIRQLEALKGVDGLEKRPRISTAS